MVIVNSVDNVLGQVEFALTQLNPSPAKSGTGSLIVVTFLGEEVGALSPLEMVFVQLAAPRGIEIPNEAQSGSLLIVAEDPDVPTNTPVPTQPAGTTLPSATPPNNPPPARNQHARTDQHGCPDGHGRRARCHAGAYQHPPGGCLSNWDSDDNAGEPNCRAAGIDNGGDANRRRG